MKGKLFKRGVAFAAAIAMSFSILPSLPLGSLPSFGIIVSAAEIARSGQTPSNLSDELAAKKQLGDNVFYSLDDSGTLTITGTGSMYDFEADNDSPLFDATNIYKVVISEGITNIGAKTFNWCRYIRSVSLPSTINYIGDSAFENCDSLSDINIPNSVTRIENSAFYYCKSLSSIVIPDSVVFMGSHMFYNNSSLMNVQLSSNIKSIGYATFFGCERLQSITIPAGVTSIDKQAFYGCSALTSIDIPEGITTISEAAFIYCSGLKTVKLPSTLTSIDGWGFDSCTSITEITIPNGVTSIGKSAFRLNKNLKKITIPASVTSIGENAFIGDDKLTIYGYKGTTAETYANENSIPFVALDGQIPDVPTLDPDKYLSYACTSGKTEFTYDTLNKKFKPDSSTLSCSLFYNQLPTTVTEPEYFFTINKIEITAPQGFSFGENGSPNYLERFGPAELYTVASGDKKSSYDFQIPLYPISYTKNEVELVIKVYGNNNFEKTFSQKITINRPTPIDVNNDYDKTDTDGDGLPDVWETNGIIYEGEFLDLNSMGADPNVPDLFVEVDWMRGYNLDEDCSNAFYIVYKQFKNHGINLHIDAGSGSIMDYTKGTKWGALSASNEIEYHESILSSDANGGNLKGNWKNLIDKNFNNVKVRSLVFRHCIMADNIKNKSGTLISGTSSGIPHQYYIVGLGWIKRQWLTRYDVAIAGTFMHELGHTLGLWHGGFDSFGIPDMWTMYKPNYLSIMNYSFQLYGLKYNEDFTRETGIDDLVKYVNYSEWALPPLDETALNENKGVDPYRVTENTGLGTRWFIKGSPFDTDKETISGNKIDFNKNGKYESFIMQNINSDDILLPLSILMGTSNDWVHIKYKGGAIGGNGAYINSLFSIFTSDEFKFEIPDEAPAEDIVSVCTQHNVSSNWDVDSIGHWHICSDCDALFDYAEHISNGGKVTIQPTATTTGVRTYSCSVCGYVMNTETVPATGGSGIPSNSSNNPPSNPYYNTPSYPAAVIPSASAAKLTVKAEVKKDTVTLTWDKIKGAKSYTVYQYKDGKYVELKTTKDTSATFKKLKNGKTYKFLVRYTKSGKLSSTANSGKVSVTIKYKPIVKATSTENSVTLKWSAVEGAEKYAVYKYVNGKAVKLTETDKRAVKYGKLDPHKKYRYIVRAYVDGKWTDMSQSDIVTVTTK